MSSTSCSAAGCGMRAGSASTCRRTGWRSCRTSRTTRWRRPGARPKDGAPVPEWRKRRQEPSRTPWGRPLSRCRFPTPAAGLRARVAGVSARRPCAGDFERAGAAQAAGGSTPQPGSSLSSSTPFSMRSPVLRRVLHAVERELERCGRSPDGPRPRAGSRPSRSARTGCAARPRPCRALIYEHVEQRTEAADVLHVGHDHVSPVVRRDFLEPLSSPEQLAARRS